MIEELEAKIIIKPKQEMSDIQKQCWDNYHTSWTKQDFEESDKEFIENLKKIHYRSNL